MTNDSSAPTCDSHVHVIGEHLTYPMAAGRQYTPDLASVQSLVHHLQAVGCARCVVVQPSVYGYDNRCTMDSLVQLTRWGLQARAVVVVPESITDAELQQLDRQGARGVRLNLESAPGTDQSPEQSLLQTRRLLEHWSKRLARLGWHLQVYGSAPRLKELWPTLDAIEAPVVLDHFAMIDPGNGRDDGYETHVRQLLATARIYVKLSAAYRLPGLQNHHEADLRAQQIDALARRLIISNPDQILWGSDWPHTRYATLGDQHAGAADNPFSPSALNVQRHRWLADSGVHEQILAANAARLYRF